MPIEQGPSPKAQEKPNVHVLRRSREWAQRKFGRVIKEVTLGADTAMTFLPSGRIIMDATKDLIRTATHHSYTQSYTFEKDTVGEEVIETFKTASATHPDVKYGLLVDQIIAVHNVHGVVRRRNHLATEQKTQTFDALQDLNDNGHAQVVVTNTFNLFGKWWTSNFLHRDHKKVATADGSRAIVGSANIGDHHVRWTDAGIFLNGPAAKIIEEDVAATFAKAKEWERVHKTKSVSEYQKRYGLLPRGHDLLGAIVRNRQDRGQNITINQPNGEMLQVLTDSWFPWYQEATNEGFRMIATAKKGTVIDITSPYPGMFSLTRKMKRAIRNGAEVNLIIPANNNSPLYNEKSINAPRLLKPLIRTNKNMWMKRLKRAGIHVYEFDGDTVNQGMLHVKSVRVQNADNRGEVLLGSMNLGKGIITHWDREIGVKVNNTKVLEDYDTFVSTMKSQSRRLF